ncbi:MAG: PqqD family protein [Rhizobiales bacterium]|nr:PqqD family protein [Hyphomicrobiales bacterium]
MTTGQLAIAAPKCVADDFNGEIVALNLESGLYFSLRDLAGAVWRDLVAGHRAEDVVRAVSDSDPALGGEVGALVDRLLAEGLLRPVATDVPATGDITAAAFAAAGARAILVDTYDDMRDLVLTDPVHEVDEEAGWPTRREDT